MTKDKLNQLNRELYRRVSLEIAEQDIPEGLGTAALAAKYGVNATQVHRRMEAVRSYQLQKT